MGAAPWHTGGFRHGCAPPKTRLCYILNRHPLALVIFYEAMFEEQVKAKITELRPMLQADGGDMSLVKIEGKTVFLKLHGACGHCPHATVTLKNGVERVLRETVDSGIIVERVMGDVDPEPPDVL